MIYWVCLHVKKNKLKKLFDGHIYRYKNRPNMTFDDTGAEADQTFEMQPDRQGILEYQTQ